MARATQPKIRELLWFETEEREFVEMLFDASVNGRLFHRHNLGMELESMAAELSHLFKKEFTLKKLYAKFKGLFNRYKIWNHLRGISGLCFDSTKNMFTGSPELWDEIIKAKPEAATYRYKGEKYGDDLIYIFGGQEVLPPLAFLELHVENQANNEVIVLSDGEDELEGAEFEVLLVHTTDSKAKAKEIDGFELIVIEDSSGECDPPICVGKGKGKLHYGESSLSSTASWTPPK